MKRKKSRRELGYKKSAFIYDDTTKTFDVEELSVETKAIIDSIYSDGIKSGVNFKYKDLLLLQTELREFKKSRQVESEIDKRLKNYALFFGWCLVEPRLEGRFVQTVNDKKPVIVMPNTHSGSIYVELDSFIRDCYESKFYDNLAFNYDMIEQDVLMYSSKS